MRSEFEGPTREDYMRAKHFLDLLKHTEALTLQQKRTLWGQAVHGDVKAARRGYDRLMGREPK